MFNFTKVIAKLTLFASPNNFDILNICSKINKKKIKKEMKKKMGEGCIGQFILNRANIVRLFSNEIKKNEIEKNNLRNDLIDLAPVHLAYWFEQDCVVENLFLYGKHETIIRFNTDFDFGDAEDVNTKFEELSKAWDKVVSITIDRSKPNQVAIGLKVIFNP